MKRRITYIQRPEAPFVPEEVVVSTKSVTVRGLDATREDRLTFDLDDLPEELHKVCHQLQELHLRWATERPFDAVAPFVSRVSPGLHVHYTPLAAGQSSEALCSVLRTVFGVTEGDQYGVDCTNPEDNFIAPPLRATESGAAASLQYHTQLPSLKSLVTFFQNNVCAGGAECITRANSLLTADVVDLDFDASSNTLTMSGIWTSAPEGGWVEEVHKSASSSDKVEFGLLGTEKGISADEIKVGGLLAVVGEDKKLKPTMFSFPSRHHVLPRSASYTVSFAEPTGLHPTMSISIPRSSLELPSAPDDTTCALYTYLTLPSSVFGDQYQLGTTDPLFLESHNLEGLRAHSGETDLEAPDWVVKGWGSNWLFELATPVDDLDGDVQSNWTATIPLHLRYLHPSETGYRSAHVPWPVVFWACGADDATGMGINPFDRRHLGYDSLFSPHTFFYQLHPKSDRLVEVLDVPVLHLKDGEGLFQARNIELTTCAVISLGFLWILWRLVRVAWSSGLGSNGKPNGSDEHDKKE
ncbi:hypothetical protein N7520_008987 [Penicillium odoratum]|uniref:uncharacterized protein n=1 Tax=Penicillium odoratum TaxID=1167516 RepID=UPI002549B22B|nr:uncharacterized protein N7520_008987 [Penicillium odoratum]KAJ5752070.1 hypothetical protein N7520_008987 [Penicillium odoratum]